MILATYEVQSVQRSKLRSMHEVRCGLVEASVGCTAQRDLSLYVEDAGLLPIGAKVRIEVVEKEKVPA